MMTRTATYPPRIDDEELRRIAPPAGLDGFGALETERGVLPLKALHVSARVEGLIGSIEMVQTFVNAFDVALEATYIFPLPDRAAVTSFRMEVAGRVVEGVLKEREKARADYDAAIAAGQRAAIAEEERPDVFTLRVGNLLPGEAATVRLGLVGPLPYADGEITVRVPLVVAPRYIPGTPLEGPDVGSGTALDTDAVPDASRITPPVLLPGFPNPVRLSIEVHVDDPTLGPDDLRCSLHAAYAQVEDGGWRVWIEPGERLDRDFILRLRIADETIRTSLDLEPDPSGEGGTLALRVVPPRSASTTASGRPRAVALVLDRSGSMEGWKMVAARRALARIVDTLTDEDVFDVQAFGNSIEQPPGFPDREPKWATDRNRFRVVEWLSNIHARGGTAMAEPLERAIHWLQMQVPARDLVLILVTDGQVGQEDQILQSIGRNADGIRIHVVGIDQAVNAGFLHRLAGLGEGGSCELVESEDRLDVALSMIHRNISSAVLADLELLLPNGITLEPDSLVPTKVPDVLAGAPALLLARYRGATQSRESGSATVMGTDTMGHPHLIETPVRRISGRSLAVVWARGRLRALEDERTINSRSTSIAEWQIVELSLKFGVLCRFTAFVAVDSERALPLGMSQHSVTQPVDRPQGMVACCAAPPPTAQFRKAAGGYGGGGRGGYGGAERASRMMQHPAVASPGGTLRDSAPVPSSLPHAASSSPETTTDYMSEFVEVREEGSGWPNPPKSVDYVIVGQGESFGVYRAQRAGTSEDVRFRPIAGSVDDFRAVLAILSSLGEPIVVQVLDVIQGDEGRWFVVVAVPAGAQPLGVGQAISPRQAAETVFALAKFADRLQAAGLALNAIPEGSVVRDPQGGIRFLGLESLWHPPGQPARKPSEPSANNLLARLMLSLVGGQPDAKLSRRRDLGLGLPEPLAEIVRRGSETNPARRYASVGALADALDAWLAATPDDPAPPAKGRRGSWWK